MYLDTSSRLSRISNRRRPSISVRTALVTFASFPFLSPLPPRLARAGWARRTWDVRRDRYRWVAKTATGLPVGLHAKHMCTTRRLRLGFTRRSFGCGLSSQPLPTPRRKQQRGRCHATRSWWHAAVLIAPWGLTGPFTQSREALHALEGKKLLQQRS